MLFSQAVSTMQHPKLGAFEVTSSSSNSGGGEFGAGTGRERNS
jgi:hypothetical protein